ncbi:MAG TPA: ASCH domain-containing protein [bacterium]|nr:ASCH domain-containing protein [bacterium]HPN67208.1 ASCH domain-containing protein [bacterium]
MKTLKFRASLSQLILRGQKNSTWRLFDDKDLSIGDRLSLLVWETGHEFVRAKIVDVRVTTLGKLTAADWDGHEKFPDLATMYRTYSQYYHQPVDASTEVKIIRFQLIADRD